MSIPEGIPTVVAISAVASVKVVGDLECLRKQKGSGLDRSPFFRISRKDNYFLQQKEQWADLVVFLRLEYFSIYVQGFKRVDLSSGKQQAVQQFIANSIYR